MKSNTSLLILFNGKNHAGRLDLKRFSFKFNCLSKLSENNFQITYDSNIAKNKSSLRRLIFRILISFRFDKQSYVALFIMPSLKDVGLALIFKLFSQGRLRIVPIIHNTQTHISSNNYIFDYLIKAIQNTMFRVADRVLFLSSDVMLTWKPSSKRFYRTNLPILPSSNSLSPISNDFRLCANENPEENKRIKILIIGRYLAYKKLKTLDDALSILISRGLSPNLEFLIMGSGYPQSDINSLASRLLCLEIPFQYNDRYVPDELVDQFILDADYTFFWYTHASQSGFLQRSIELGTSVICNNIGGLKEQLGSAHGFCINSDSFSLAKLLSELPSPPENVDINGSEILENDANLVSFLFGR